MKKAQGLPFNTIIIAAIAIVVLIVVLLFFTGKFSQSNDALNDCEAKGGESSATTDCANGGIPTPTGLEGEDKYCCIKIGSS